MRRLWRSAPWSRNPLMGGFHRLETVAVAVIVAFVLLMVPIAGAIGTVYYANSSERAQGERDTRKQVARCSSRIPVPPLPMTIRESHVRVTTRPHAGSSTVSNTSADSRLLPARRPVRKSPCGSTPTRCPRPRHSPGFMPGSTASRSPSRCGSFLPDPPSQRCTSCTGSDCAEGWLNGTVNGKRPITGRRGSGNPGPPHFDQQAIVLRRQLRRCRAGPRRRRCTRSPRASAVIANSSIPITGRRSGKQGQRRRSARRFC